MSALQELKQLEPLAGEVDVLEPPLATDSGENIDPEGIGNNQPPPDEASLQARQEAINTGVYMAFSIIAPNWEVTAEEATALGESITPVLDKYFPNVGANMGCEMNLGLAVALTLGPRIAQGIPRKPEKEVNERPAHGSEAPPEPEDGDFQDMPDIKLD